MLELLPPLKDARILDAGCGSGWYAEQLLARGARVDGVDSSAAMVDYAQRRLLGDHSTEFAHRLTLQVADLAGSLPFDDGVFDGVVSPLVLHYMRDWRPALRELHRVMKPGAWLLFSTHHPAADAARFGTTNYAATEHVVDHWDWVGDVEFYRRPLSEVVAAVVDSGFVIEKLVEPVPVAEFRALSPESWEGLMRQPEFLILRVRAVSF